MESAAGLIVSGAFLSCASWNEDLVFPERYTREENGYSNISTQSSDSLESDVPARSTASKYSSSKSDPSLSTTVFVEDDTGLPDRHSSSLSKKKSSGGSSVIGSQTETMEKMWRGVKCYSSPAMYAIGWILIIAGVSSNIYSQHRGPFLISLIFVPVTETISGWCIKQFILSRVSPSFSSVTLSKIRQILLHGYFCIFLVFCLFTTWAVVSAYGKTDSLDTQDGKFLAISAILIPFSEILLMITRHRESDLKFVFPNFESAIEVLIAVMYYMRVLLPGSYIMFAISAVKLTSA